MNVAQSYSDAQRVGDERALRDAEQGLSELLKRNGFE